MRENILIVDRRAAPPAPLAETLSRAGFRVRTDDGYEYSPAARDSGGGRPDLVILCCESVAREERAFVERVLADGCCLIILCAALPWYDSRVLLLANSYNLGGDSLAPDGLIELIDEAFFTMYGKSAFRESHHLKSSLGMIEFYVSNIRQILSSENVINTELDRELDKVVNDVKGVLSRSRGLQKRASEYDREEAGRKSETLIGVNALLEQAKWALPSPPSNISLTFDLRDDLARVSVVVGQVIEILRNLVENAIEAMLEQGGAISVRAFNAPPNVQIEVADTGPGIPEAHQHEIFKRFFSTKGSSGFGLWDASNFARYNRGQLTLESRPGQGATFILKLPMVGEGAEQ